VKRSPRSAITCSHRAASDAPGAACSPPSYAATPARVDPRGRPRSSCCTPRRCSTTTRRRPPSCDAVARPGERALGQSAAPCSQATTSTRASSLIVEDGDLDILWIFADTIRSMAEGELLQLQRSFDPSVTEAHYFSR
jgi:geranylgeranyl pyrophosphate synthase